MALPLFALGCYEVYIEAKEEVGRIEDSALALARITAVDAERMVMEAEWLLSGLVERLRLRSDEDGRCDMLFSHFGNIHPRFNNLVLFDGADRLACSALPRPSNMRHLPPATLNLLRQVRAERKLIVGPAHQSAVSGDWTVLLAYPVAETGWVVGVSIGLMNFHPLAGSTSAASPEGAYFSILDRDGTVIAHSRDPKAMVGRNFRHVPLVAAMLAKRQGAMQEKDKDGQKRIVGFMPIAGTAWLAMTVLPMERILHEVVWVAAEHALFVLAALAFMVFIAWRMARGITLPAERIAAAAHDIEDGETTRRLPVEGPDEIATLAQQINRTLDVLAEREDDLRALSGTLEQRVAERTVDLERANAELESFSYSISHDLRAPLRALSGFASILATDERDKLTPAGRVLLDRIAHNAVRMGELIDDLLQFSRIGRGQMRRGEVRLAELAQSVAEELHEQYPSARLTIGPLPVVSGDAAMLRQVLVNLISNALKFSAKRSDAVVEVGVEEKEGEQVIFVRDNGAGFDMQYAQKLFGVFQRMHTESQFPGTGVGLAIVKRIIERHGGRVWAEASPGLGAVFCFTL